jgi:hypothetical protein
MQGTGQSAVEQRPDAGLESDVWTLVIPLLYSSTGGRNPRFGV